MTLMNGGSLAYTIREAAQALAVSERTIRRAVNQGKLRVVRIGRCVRIPSDSIRDLLFSQNNSASKCVTTVESGRNRMAT